MTSFLTPKLVINAVINTILYPILITFMMYFDWADGHSPGFSFIYTIACATMLMLLCLNTLYSIYVFIIAMDAIDNM